MKTVLLAGASALAAMMAGQAFAGSDYSAAWQLQINDTAAVQAAANGGAGITVATIDTGAVASNPEIAGRVSPLSSCAAVTFKCSNGFTDDNGHGTAVASILGGKFSATAPISMSGVAPAVTIVSEKVLNASGSGYDTDVANGIIKAAQAGAKVINLSLTYIPTAAVVSAVNYAVADGAVIVWAGGNSSAPLNGGANSLGFSAAVASHLIFVGSVGSTNKLSSFSNTPGTAGLTIGGATTSYASLWLMAPGENIVAPGIQFGSTAYAYWTGTSMSTPEISGAVALLDAAWPVLIRNGDTTTVLFKTATSLGAASSYGDGLLNLAKAFQPIGTLTVTGVNGASIPVTSITGTMISGGALGPLSSIKSELSNYTAFDVYQRNFSVNLSGLISTASTSANSQGSATPPVTVTTSTPGGKFMIVGAAPVSFADGAFGARGTQDLNDHLTGGHSADPSYMAFAGDDGSFWAVGQGVASGLAFAQATWGADNLAAEQTGDLGVAGALVNLAQGGYSAAIGGETLGRLRIAAAWSSSPPPIGSAEVTDRNRSDASAAAVAVTARLTSRWSLGATFSSLKEDNALLGTTYDGAGPLTLGLRHQSRLVGVSSAFDLGGQRSILAEASTVASDGASMQSGLIRSVSPTKAVAWGVSFIQGDALKPGDSLSVSVRQPLRVTSGEAQLAVTSVDDQGYSTTTFTPVSLAPSGHETDVTVGYAAPMGQNASFRGAVSMRQDVENEAGLNDVAVRAGMNLVF
jgi:hypothetical protein